MLCKEVTETSGWIEVLPKQVGGPGIGWGQYNPVTLWPDQDCHHYAVLHAHQLFALHHVVKRLQRQVDGLKSLQNR